MNDSSSELEHRVMEHLTLLYPTENILELTDKLISTMGISGKGGTPLRHQNLWDESDSILITYGNSIIKQGEAPLKTLKGFIDKHLSTSINTVHILPFFPYSSDDGFSVIDYLAVNPELGSWEDISDLAKNYNVMSDLVINHISSQSSWFENFKNQCDPGKDYFVEADPYDNLHEVVRPRNSPLLTSVETTAGTRHVWCTFSEDQVDLNFKNPKVLIEFVNIIREYLDHGIKIFRLDAVAFLWKNIGTSCIHLQETHEVIKLLRTLIEHKSPSTIIVTETNVPNRENLTYFGNANEAHIIYNFSLPPLLLYTLLSGDCRHLKTWMMSMPPAQSGTAYLNFIASHDGIGLRPLDDLVSDGDQEALAKTIKSFGGHVTMRRAREGHDKAYELNISLYDAMQGTIDNGPDQWQAQRFICAHTIMLALEGIPALYIHSLFGTENDYKRVNETGRVRTINRHIWQTDELFAALSDKKKHHASIFKNLIRLLNIRRQQPAFHPNATQFTLHLGLEVFTFWRQSVNRDQSIFCLNNITNKDQLLNLADINLISTDSWVDLISGVHYEDLSSQLLLSPYQSVWLSNCTREQAHET